MLFIVLLLFGLASWRLRTVTPRAPFLSLIYEVASRTPGDTVEEEWGLRGGSAQFVQVLF